MLSRAGVSAMAEVSRGRAAQQRSPHNPPYEIDENRPAEASNSWEPVQLNWLFFLHAVFKLLIRNGQQLKVSGFYFLPFSQHCV